MSDRPTVELPESIQLPRLLDFYELPTPEHTQIAEFYERLDGGSLSTTECTDCGERHFPPRIICPECHSDALTFVELPDTGELFAFTEVRAGAPLGMEDDVPFVVGIVEIDGLRMSARIDEARAEALAIGDTVSLRIVDVAGPGDEERVFYRFVPTDE